MRILCLIDWPAKAGDRWLWKYLPDNHDEIEFLSASGSVDRFPKWGKLITYYPAYWRMAIRAMLQVRRKHYDAVVAWEGKNGFPYALLRSITGQKEPPLIILTFIYRGLIRHFGPIARFGLRSVSAMSVTTPFEVDYYSHVLEIDGERMEMLPFPWYDNQWAKTAATEPEPQPFILASGRSYRDYATLAEAVRGLDVKVVILARKFNLDGVTLPDNVEVSDLLSLVEYQKLLHRAQFVVVPLQDLPHSAGDSHLAQSMSAGKAIIASRTPSPEAYIEHGVNGLLVPPGDAQSLRDAIQDLSAHPEQIASLGAAARCSFESKHTFERFSAEFYQLLQRVTNANH